VRVVLGLLTVKGDQPTLLEAIQTEVTDQYPSEAVDRRRRARKSRGSIVGQVFSVLSTQGIVDPADWRSRDGSARNGWSM
jgi:hypothetical protein